MKKVISTICVFSIMLSLCGCGQRLDASNNSKMVVSTEQESETALSSSSGNKLRWQKDSNGNIIKGTATYECDLDADRANYDGHVDIVVGDDYYTTQINDWFMNFDGYDGKVVEIEGYYISEFSPYQFVGRYGPTCQYCTGNYVSFEILTDENLSDLGNAQSWIKVTGILRMGSDTDGGAFPYIEALKVERMPEVGQDTVTN